VILLKVKETQHLYYWFLAATVFLHDSVTLFQREYLVLMSWKMSWNFVIFLSWKNTLCPVMCSFVRTL